MHQIFMVMIKRQYYTLLVAVLTFTIQANAQTTTSENTYKGFNITANATGGVCSYLLWSDTFLTLTMRHPTQNPGLSAV